MVYRSNINGESGARFIAEALAEIGPLENPERVRASVIAQYTGRVPDMLLDIWDNFGIGDLGGGRMRLCIPADLQEAVDHLVDGDPYLGQGTLALAYGAFGDLILWNAQHQMVFVNMQLSSVEVPALIRPALIDLPDRVVLENLLQISPMSLDAMDDQAQPMFEAARARYGDLPALHIYGMQPADPVDQPFSVDNHAIVDVTEWLHAKFASSVFNLDDPDGRRLALREIGPLTEGEPLMPWLVR